MRKSPVVSVIIWMGLLTVPATPALAQRTETLDKSFTLTATGPALQPSRTKTRIGVPRRSNLSRRAWTNHFS